MEHAHIRDAYTTIARIKPLLGFLPDHRSNSTMDMDVLQRLHPATRDEIMRGMSVPHEALSTLLAANRGTLLIHDLDSVLAHLREDIVAYESLTNEHFWELFNANIVGRCGCPGWRAQVIHDIVAARA